ncbi:glycosyltransferase family 2 protein [Lysobacter arenosi]|jgi:glycosyltransferase involved in cell wall biosynthesis|uniref:Glycosyltransferase family 2 protein n=1 Tax=Lysobacter arenosi TaxID=2795387 RepID=A0ABX7R8A3_9GAMM|nr:glycosyltransferase family 2 protein [Lysobacter arenosi]QSX73636.1 glycosyltransferase family 2 protein [Lysobacter arenosi]
MSKISYVLPVYHNQGSIKLTWQEISALFAGPLSAHEYEVIFVDDGSKDASYAEMLEVAALDSNVRTITFSRNFGQIAAIVAGYRHATGDAIINMSADLQDPVELTVEMVRKWEAGSDVVVAHREDREDSVGASLFSRLAYGALRASNPAIPAGGFDFVLMSRRALDQFLQYKGRNRFFQGDVIWAGFATTYLPYVRRKRTIGKSQYNFSKKLKLFFDFLLDGSYLPIRLMSLCGVIVALLGALYAAVIVVAWALGKTPFSGWAPLMVAILLVGGIIMLMLGIIGEYLWRILDEIKEKPLYVIKEEQ